MKISDALKQGRDIYVCSDCATKNGGIWPKDHVATWHPATCDDCGRDEPLCSLSDWEWPGKAGESKMRAMREF